ncbi:Major facilitator superfamily protein [Rhynchospora pubera]|uniref:Major facilitator superfamily protein n=1 Tax=Rhynchospora pubera TaxID=906938 RepID=A0AAV8HK59_9POAL|nr:Major facilitator superfamily protein [Rhynchospora pubera]
MKVKVGTRPPWIGLAAAAWVEVAAGSAYCFPLYSHAAKTVLGIDQRGLTMLGVANDIGENFGLVPGVLCNRLPPWSVLSVAAVLSFVGYGIMWLAVSKTVVGIPYWVLWIALCIATNSSAWLGTSILVTNMRNFPLSRGTVAGILKGYVGLSAAVYTEVYTGVLHNSATHLLLCLSLGIPAVCFLSMYFVRPCTPSVEEENSSEERCHFLFTQLASVILGVYLLVSTVLDDVLGLSTHVTYALFGGMFFLLFAPLAIPVKMTLWRKKRELGSIDRLVDWSSEEISNLLIATSSSVIYASDEDILLAEGEGAIIKKKSPRRGEDFEFCEALIKADFWLLFMVYFLGVGSGVTVLNNLAQIGIAAGTEDTTILLSLFSFCNFVGRLGGGAVSEHFVRSRMLPRPIWMTLTQIIMVISYLLFASGIPATLYTSTALLGICYGVQFSVMVPTASELFGLKHFGMMYNFMLLGNPLGAFLFSGLLAGYIYDKEAARQYPGFGSSISCFGPNCFRVTFLVLAGMCTLGTVLSAVLTVRIRPVYQMLYASGSFRHPRSTSIH